MSCEMPTPNAIYLRNKVWNQSEEISKLKEEIKRLKRELFLATLPKRRKY